jgi:FkbM family methyltransferase
MNDSPVNTPELRRLLKRLSRFREQRRRRGLDRLLTRQRKASLLGALRHQWPGGYVLTDDGELAYVPAPLDDRGERMMFYGFAAVPAALVFAPPGGVVIDVGANLGEWSVPLARAVGRAGGVLCIEPNPVAAAALAATLRINNLAQTEVLPFALAAEDGQGRLLIEPGDSGLSRLSSSPAAIPVPLRRLDSIVAERELTRLDLLKIDVEGYERHVLAGAAESLRRFRPAVVFESGHEASDDRRAVAVFFDELDYDLVAVLHDYGALQCGERDYAEAARACAGTEARNILALPRGQALTATGA